MPNDEAKIKGSVIKDPRDWARTSYGADAYQAALAKLTADERALIDGQLLAGTWYPIGPWDRFLAAMRAEAKARKGHSEYEFDMRNMREAGSAILRNIYKFVLSFMSPTSVVDKAALIYGRVYSEGRCEIGENKPGRAVVRFVDTNPAFRTNLSHMFPTGLFFVMEQAGVKGVDVRVSRDEIVNGRLFYEATLTYKA